MREIVHKEIDFANKEELHLILLNEVKEDKSIRERMSRKDLGLPLSLNADEEIDSYLESKNNIISSTRIKLFFNTKETITLFSVFFTIQDPPDEEKDNYESKEDMLSGEGGFSDPNGNYFFYNKLFVLENGKLEDITNNDYLFVVSRELITNIEIIEKTVKNKDGEDIHIRVQNGKVLVHHEDATDGFVSLDELFTKIILDSDEILLIKSTVNEIINNQ